jgi:hypothetical protein
MHLFLLLLSMRAETDRVGLTEKIFKCWSSARKDPLLTERTDGAILRAAFRLVTELYGRVKVPHHLAMPAFHHLFK